MAKDRPQRTAYLDPHQEVILELRPELNTSGTLRVAFDDWLADEDIDVEQLEQAAEAVNAEVDSLREVTESMDSVEEFVEYAAEHTEGFTRE